MHEIQRERREFMNLCGAKDKKILSGEEEMTFQDFDRLTYITDFLGFSHLNVEIWNQYIPQFKEKYDLLQQLDEEYDGDEGFAAGEEQIDRYQRWIEAFCDCVPDREEKRKLKKRIGAAGGK